MDAVTQGTVEGISLFLNIVCMLVVLVALVYLANKILGFFPGLGGQPVTLQRLLGYIMAPVVWLIGIPLVGGQDGGGAHGHKNDPQ